jgi:signal transduction histidine kinase
MADSRDQHAKTLGLVVHEFRTPITVVAGYVRMLLQHFGEGLGDQQRKLLEEAEKSCGRLSALVADLSELGSVESGQAGFAEQDVPIFDLLREVAGGVHEGQDRGVTLQLSGGEASTIVAGDRNRLRKALDAVLTATLREHVQPGVVPVSAAVDEIEGRGRFALIVIDDPTTEGASRFDPERWGAFQEFRGGVGFSLPLARAVVERSGGRIWSLKGTGARSAVALALPLKERNG